MSWKNPGLMIIKAFIIKASAAFFWPQITVLESLNFALKSPGKMSMKKRGNPGTACHSQNHYCFWADGAFSKKGQLLHLRFGISLLWFGMSLLW